MRDALLYLFTFSITINTSVKNPKICGGECGCSDTILYGSSVLADVTTPVLVMVYAETCSYILNMIVDIILYTLTILLIIWILW